MSEPVRAFWIAAPGRGEIRSQPLSAPSSGDVVVRTLYSAISRGTESLVFEGRVPPSEFTRMRAPFQEGDFPAPVKYGYASVGEIEHGSRDLEGRHAFVLYPHQTKYVVPAEAIHLIPSSVPPARAVLAANLETAVNGVWDAAIKPGDRVVVIGGGAVGCLAAWLAAKIPGCEVELVDVNPKREAIARQLGVSFAGPMVARGDADVVLHASGSADGLATAMLVAGFEATVVELSWYGNKEVPVLLGGGFHARRLTLKSSQVGHVAASQRARWDTRRRMAFALSLLVHDELDVLVTGESAFDDLPSAMARLASSPGDTICHRIKYE
ncbi:MAG TPA: zinc-binding alcohol dehydrogenase [Vicinamibacterales bacterium]|nr:zinc-binding alcohol dehydrogenase [Vicinamibacterales bacterium]